MSFSSKHSKKEDDKQGLKTSDDKGSKIEDEKKNTMAWSLTSLNIVERMKEGTPKKSAEKKDSTDYYSIFNTEHVSYRSPEELAELHIATQLPPAKLVSFRPERAAWHETIVAVSTRLQVKDEDDLYQMCINVYQNINSDAMNKVSEEITLMKKAAERHIVRIVKDIQQNKPIPNEKFATEVKQFYEKIQKADLGNYVKDYNPVKATIAYFTDKQTNEITRNKMRQLLDNEMQKHILAKVYEPLTIPKPTERRSFMLAGGPASGKGSSVALLMAEAKEHNIPWPNILKINTDFYKMLLLEPGSCTPEHFSQYCQDEAIIVKNLILSRYEEMVNLNQAPHYFGDQVVVGRDRINLALRNSGTASMIIVSTDVADAVERSYARGLLLGRRGRYESTQIVLMMHRRMTEEIPTELREFLGRAVHVRIVDNNVPKGNPPILIMEINLETRQAIIHDPDKVNRFLTKVRIDDKAKGAEGLYKGVAPTINEFFKPLIDSGLTIVFNASAVLSKDPLRKTPS